MAKKNILLIGFIAILLFYTPVLFLNETRLLALTDEDGIYESIGALMFFFAAIGFLVNFLKAKKRNLFFLLFACAFFFAAGEEISWGQRILHFGTPAAVAAVNAQKEFSIHNLNIFQHTDHKLGMVSSIKDLLNFNELFILFWLVYCVMLPLANRFAGPVRRLCARVRLPVPSLWIGMLFLFNEVLCKLLELFTAAYLPFTQDPKISEIKETLWALIVFLMALYFFYELQAQFATRRQPELAVGHLRFEQTAEDS